MSFPDLTEALKKNDNHKDFLNEEIFAVIERYVILIKEKLSQLTDACVYHLSISYHEIIYIISNLQTRDPWCDALIEHLKRSI